MTYCKIGSHTNASATLNYGKFKNGKKRENIVVAAINCTPETAKEEFAFVRNLYGKNDGIQVHTIIQSFDSGVTMEQANKIGIETAQRLFPGHQVVVYTHCDGKGGKIHNHIMANAVNFETGKKYDNHGLIYKARETSDEICQSHGLGIIPYDTPTKKEIELTSQGVKPWKDKLRETLNKAKSTAKNLDEFKETLKNEGIEINVRNSRKEGGQAWTYVVNREDWGLKGRKIRGRTLGDDYTFSRITKSVSKNQKQSEDVKPTPKPEKNTAHNIFANTRHKYEKIKDKYNQDLTDILNYCSPTESKSDIILGDDGKPQIIETKYKDPIYGKDFIKDNINAIKLVASKDFSQAAKSLSPETMMRYVVNLHGTNFATLSEATSAITTIKNETPNFAGQLLQYTLNTNEYKIAYKAEKGVWSNMTPKIASTSKSEAKGVAKLGRVSRVITGQRRISGGMGGMSHTSINTKQNRNGILSNLVSKLSGDGDKWTNLDLPRIKQQWDDDWAWLSEAEKAEIRANLDNIDRY